MQSLISNKYTYFFPIYFVIFLLCHILIISSYSLAVNILSTGTLSFLFYPIFKAFLATSTFYGIPSNTGGLRNSKFWKYYEDEGNGKWMNMGRSLGRT